ncbi:MAG: DUF2157 domain-containing protein [Acidobacteriota bacterium]
MAKKYIQWLYEELPSLVDKGVLTPESAQKLRTHYGVVKARSGFQLALIISSVLGALLIGLGIILLFAHNWEDLSRPTRTVLSLAPLIIGQLLAGSTIWRKSDSVAWREGSSTFLMIAIGAAIALISQTYQIPGDMTDFLLTWILLGIPLVYLMNATVPVLIYFVLLTLWAGNSAVSGENVLLYWPLVALVIPYLRKLLKVDRYDLHPMLILWGLSLSLCWATGVTLGNAAPGLWVINYSSLFALMYLIGTRWFDENARIVKNPLQAVGTIGLLVIAYILSYRPPWEEIGSSHYWQELHLSRFEFAADVIMTAAFFVTVLYMLIRLRLYRGYKGLYMMIPVPAIIAFILNNQGSPIMIPVIIFNLYLIALGVVTLSAGLKEENLETVNLGMLILLVVIVSRFFDLEFSFLTRGIAFIVCGAGFLLTNLVLLRRKKGGAQ